MCGSVSSSFGTSASFSPLRAPLLASARRWSCPDTSFIKARGAPCRSPRARRSCFACVAACAAPSVGIRRGGGDDNPLAVVSSTTTFGVCSNCPYGWFCDPSAVEYDAVLHPERRGGVQAAVLRVALGAIPRACLRRARSSAWRTAARRVRASACSRSLTCASSRCPSASGGLHRRFRRHQFFVNPYNGERRQRTRARSPWKTLKRAQAQSRYGACRHGGAPDSVTSCWRPVQLRICATREQEEAPRVSNSTRGTMGYTITE